MRLVRPGKTSTGGGRGNAAATLSLVCFTALLMREALSFVPLQHQHGCSGGAWWATGTKPTKAPPAPGTSAGPAPAFFRPVPSPASSPPAVLARRRTTRRSMSDEIVYVIFGDDDPHEPDDEDDDDDEDAAEDPYMKIAKSEFVDGAAAEEDKEKGAGEENSTSTAASGGTRRGGDIVEAFREDDGQRNQPTTNVDWGGALGRLRERVDDVESGKSQDPSHALFRLLSSQSPSQQIAGFLQSAKPGVVQAMTGAVGSLLGGLAQPASGVDFVVKATGERMGSLCFQLQMTGYMFRNAEYVMALKDLMKLKGSATLEDYREAFDDLDSDQSGYIDKSEIRDLLESVYGDGKAPSFEVDAFLNFFDANNDGKITWEEFERGLGKAMAEQNEKDFRSAREQYMLSGDDEEDYDVEPDVVGTIEIELEDGKIVEVQAKEYIETLKNEAKALKAALRRETPGGAGPLPGDMLPGMGKPPMDEFGNIAEYISKRQGDIKALTEGISPEIVETMKRLVDFVLDGGESGKARHAKTGEDKRNKPKKEEMEMELPSSALQQLALWQLILGYRLREAEAKGDYLKLLD